MSMPYEPGTEADKKQRKIEGQKLGQVIAKDLVFKAPAQLCSRRLTD